MAFSNLFQEKFIHQVQVVGYLHSWSPEDIINKTGGTGSIGGDFIYYNRNDPVPDVITPLPRSGALVDGSKTVHAATVYLPNIDAPVLDKNKANTLTYLGNEKWGLSVNDKITQTYDSNELRIAIVYCARCFKDSEQKDHFYNLPENEIMSLDYILETLINGMVERSPNKFTKQSLLNLPRVDLAIQLIDYYVKYPLPSKQAALIPYNYCALTKSYPWLNPVLSSIGCN